MSVPIDCKKNIIAIHDTLDVINGKWRISILACLTMKSELLFTELKAELASISSKVLSTELRFLEENKLISREVLKLPVVKVMYKLTPYGRTLESLVFSLLDWGLTHRSEMTGINGLGINTNEYINELKANLPTRTPKPKNFFDVVL
ncbi:helix-turn-helix domain-containing protein [Danxiaibacter flavus]|uniref:Helix-turn-helix domain-containing protein n=1 Tax=Danxiaibacter flavus TaxID=3049108 RepID=A0ABV3ZI80_9BACT|nr:helix-turn-helix domain-containing protein [Chitinophagaceae bacterium DXS]